MVLASPAVFRHGWRPGWLGENLEGSPPGSAVRLRLVGLSIPRWRAVSGWSLAEPRGPKPVRRVVPAGGVYFFEVVGGGTAVSLADRWLQPVSDEQDRRDGFGLAAWGTW
jgi:CRISPR-associated protein Cmr3